MKRLTLLILAISLSVSLFGQSLLEQPKPRQLINDYANIFSDAERTELESRLVALDDSTSTQVLVVTTSDLEGMDISYLATELGHKWGVGQDGKDNGVVILIKPKTDTERGGVFIAVGYGLEGVIPDAVSKAIVDNEMIPYFSRGDMSGGVNAAISTIGSLASSEFTADQYMKKGSSTSLNVFAIFFVIFIIIMLLPRKRSVDVNGDGAQVHSSILPWLIIGSMGRGGGGGFGGSSGGFGGGGFGGFGGGGFGGGGAGGSW
ncbi:MAG: TPM domain-containing protein [Rikenellaceae bacterium]